MVYCLTDAKLKFTDPAGKSTDRDVTKGQAVWSGPVAHAVENTGKADAHVLDFELKPAVAKKEKDEKKTP